jgi:hypothetical protein
MLKRLLCAAAMNRTTTQFFGLPLLGVALLSNSAARADDDPTVWSWLCGISGYYIMDLLPSGKFEPRLESEDRTVEIIVRKKGKETFAMCASNIEYYIEMTDFQHFHFDKYRPCEQMVWLKIGTAAGEIEELHASDYVQESVIVKHDDEGWRFIESSAYLETALDVREGKAARPLPPNFRSPRAEASVSMVSGVCIMTAGTDHPSSR